MAHMRNQLRRIIVGKQDLKRVYQGLDDLKNPMEVWSGLATYEKSNSILEYMWRQYNLTVNYRWNRSSISWNVDPFTMAAFPSKGSPAGTVTSSSSTAYPNPGVSGDYYYDNRTSYYVRGTYIKNVTSTNSSAYSTNGTTGSYWYDTRTSAYIKGSLIGNVEAEEGTYPVNGRHTDGFWYVLIP